MKKEIAVFLSLILFTSSCTSIQIRGKPFYPNNSSRIQNTEVKKMPFRNLEGFFYEATEGSKKNQVTAQEIQDMNLGQPKITITKSSETWVYEYIKVEESLRFSWVGLKGKSSTKTEKLELVFDKQLYLVDYRIQPDPYGADNSNQKTKWGFMVMKWIFIGAAAGAAAGIAIKSQK